MRLAVWPIRIDLGPIKDGEGQGLIESHRTTIGQRLKG
jgi:hypothetical protein